MVLSLVFISIVVVACGNSGSTGTTTLTNGKGCTKIGLLLPDTSTSARWESKDRPLLTQKIQAALPGAIVDYNNAEGDSAAQQAQVEADLVKGDCILIVTAVDSASAATIVASAKARGVPVIAYDHPIESKNLSYYVSFDNVRVGELQGEYIAQHYKEYLKGTNANVAMINGGQTDNNALMFRQGVLNKLQPLFDNGTLKKVYDQYTPAWNNDTARVEMEGILTAQQNNIQIAYVANDGMANSVIAALKAKQLNGKVLVTGQDATVAGIQNILTGDQAMTVYKAIAKEAQAAADLVKALHDGTTTVSLTKGVTTRTTDGALIPAILETPVAVDKTNIAATVLADGFVTAHEICQGLPKGVGNFCP